MSHPGSGTQDLATTNTYRVDQSDYLLASLIPENNFLGNLEIGPEFVGNNSFTWVEDKLNANTVTSVNSYNNTDNPVTITVSAADGALLSVGSILANQASAGVVLGEQLQVTSITPGSPNYTLTASRTYGGTTIASASSSAVLQIVSSPLYENSGLGPDQSRARIVKQNFISRFGRDVNISMEQLERARAGFAPGVDDEMEYQFEQRMREMLREMNGAALNSRPSSTTPSSALTGDYATMVGLSAWLDGTYNSTAALQDEAGAALTDKMINTLNKLLQRQGGTPDWLLVGVNGVDTTAQIYNDRVRIEQSNETRGFKVKWFDTTAQNSLRILYDQQVYDTSPNGVMYLVDSGRIRIRPFVNGLFYTISAPTNQDGDAVRMISKWSLEVRNTGTDVGYAHVMAKNVQFS